MKPLLGDDEIEIADIDESMLDDSSPIGSSRDTARLCSGVEGSSVASQTISDRPETPRTVAPQTVAPHPVSPRTVSSAALTMHGPSKEANRSSSGPFSWTAARDSILGARDFLQLQTAASKFVQRTLNASLIAWFHPAGPKIGQSERIEGLLCPTDGVSPTLRDQLLIAAMDANRRNEPVAFAITAGLTLHAIPIPGFVGHCLLTIVDTPEDRPASPNNPQSSTVPGSAHVSHDQASLLVLSSHFADWSRKQFEQQSSKNAETVAALIELVSHVQASDTVESACQRLVDMLGQHLQAEKAIVGLCRQGRSDCHITAISGGTVIDPFSDETRMIESVLQESLIRAAAAVFPATNPNNRHALLSHQQLVESGFANTIVSMPIRTETGTAIGAVLLVFGLQKSSTPAQVQEAERFLRAGAGVLAGCLSVLQKLADSRILGTIRRVRAALTTSRLQMTGWITLGTATLLMIPMSYRVPCAVELQPVERRYVAAPFAGPLEECLVEPGDIVTENQLLARMDGREIRWELAEVQANLNKVIKERNTHVSKREFGDAAVLAHEIQRLEQRGKLLEHRDASLEIRSPADGVVVSGDHREAEGVPLETGQSLFEIAPLTSMVVELRVPEEDLRHVAIGMPVTVQLDAVPEESIEAVIRTIHPRAEVHDGENIFIAEADISNERGLFRPGMRGSGKVLTDRHSLGWNLFHKPIAWAIGWLGW